MIVVWVCFGTTLLSFILAALAARHIKKYGPEDTLIGHSVSDRYDEGRNGGALMQEKHNGKGHHTEHHAEDVNGHGVNGHHHA